MMEIDPDGALLLAAAIARQWIREEPHELPTVAAWLGIDVHQLRRRPPRDAHPPRGVQAGDGVTTCRHCGASLHGRPRGERGPARQFCNSSCRGRHSKCKTTR
mgnify:CR=1 FL=1